MSDYTGLLFIGDPHLAHRNIGMRKDDYPRVVLRKLAWSLDYARENRLLPCVLGDLFHTPRDNANWLVGEVCQLLVDREVIGIYGNHDIHEASLQENDTFSVLVSAQLLRQVSESDFWSGQMNGRNVIVGGSSFGQFWSDTFWPGVKSDVLVFWMTHHDLQLGPEDRSTRRLEEISGIDVVVNGHLHFRRDDVRVRKTLWMNPGNMTRTSRSEREHAPAILRIDIAAGEYTKGAGFSSKYVDLPHAPADEVFFEQVASPRAVSGSEAIINSLAELTANRTSGEGLMHYLEDNLGQFEPEVSREIRELADTVLQGKNT